MMIQILKLIGTVMMLVLSFLNLFKAKMILPTGHQTYSYNLLNRLGYLSIPYLILMGICLCLQILTLLYKENETYTTISHILFGICLLCFVIGMVMSMNYPLKF